MNVAQVVRSSAAVLLFGAGALCHASADVDPSFGADGLVALTPEPYVYSQRFDDPAIRIQMFIETLGDGRIVVGTSSTLMRLSAKGVPDPNFGYAQGGTAGRCVTFDRCNARFGSFMVQVDGSILVPLVASPSWETAGPGVFGIVKLSANGRRDPAFGRDGIALLPQVPDWDDIYAVGLSVSAGGQLSVVGSSRRRAPFGYRWSVARFSADGTPDLTFGPGGRKLLGRGTNAFPAFARSGEGRFVLGGTDGEGGSVVGVVARFLASGEPDAEFLPYQIKTGEEPFSAGGSGPVTPSALATDIDGSTVVIAMAEYFVSHVGYEGPTFEKRLLRLAADGTRDASFNSDVLAYGFESAARDPNPLAIDFRRRILHYRNDDFASGVSRFNPDGTPDLTFSATGTQRLPLNSELARAVAVQADGRILVAGLYPASPLTHHTDSLTGMERQAMWAIRPGDGLRKVRVHEFLQAANPYFFYSAFADEVQALRSPGAARAWTESSFGFDAWIEPSPELVPVCRFLSGPAQVSGYAHLFTADAAVCAKLREPNDVWIYEGIAFFVRPVTAGASIDKLCPQSEMILWTSRNESSGIENARLYHLWAIAPLPPRWGTAAWSLQEPFGCVPW